MKWTMLVFSILQGPPQYIEARELVTFNTKTECSTGMLLTEMVLDELQSKTGKFRLACVPEAEVRGLVDSVNANRPKK